MEKKYYGAPNMTAPMSATQPMTTMTAPSYVQPLHGTAGYAAPYPTSQVSPAAVAPTSVMPAQMMPPVIHPTNHTMNKNVIKHVVPHVHPNHNTTVNEHVFIHQHHPCFTQSVVNKCVSQHVMCGPIACPPRPHCGW